jgi:hypothetical protein
LFTGNIVLLKYSMYNGVFVLDDEFGPVLVEWSLIVRFDETLQYLFKSMREWTVTNIVQERSGEDCMSLFLPLVHIPSFTLRQMGEDVVRKKSSPKAMRKATMRCAWEDERCEPELRDAPQTLKGLCIQD